MAKHEGGVVDLMSDPRFLALLDQEREKTRRLVRTHELCPTCQGRVWVPISPPTAQEPAADERGSGEG